MESERAGCRLIDDPAAPRYHVQALGPSRVGGLGAVFHAVDHGRNADCQLADALAGVFEALGLAARRA